MKRVTLTFLAYTLVAWCGLRWLISRFPPHDTPMTPLSTFVPAVYFAVLFSLPAIGRLRGNSLDTRSESQMQWAYLGNVWIPLIVIAILPFSRVFAVTAAGLFFLGKSVYVYVWRVPQ